MVYVSNRCVLDQLTAGALEEKSKSIGVFYSSFRDINQLKKISRSQSTGGK